MYLPKTLSRDVIAYLNPQDMDSDRIVTKLEIKPLILLKFLEQASVNRIWFRSNFSLVLRLVTVISRVIIHQTLSWDSIFKVLRVMITNNPDVHKQVMEKGFHKDCDTQLYATLVFVAQCPGERHKWRDNVKECLNQIKCDINPKYFYLIYSTFFTGDFSKFYLIPFNDLLETLAKCKLWKYDRGLEALENIVINRINGLSKALTALTFASFNEFDRIKEHALALIKNYEFYVEEQNDKSVYTAASIEIKDNSFEDVSSFNHLQSVTDSYIQNQGKGNYKNVYINAFQIIENNEMVSIFYESKKQLEIKNLKKSPIVFFKDHSGKLQVEGAASLTDEEILGFIIAYNFKGLELINFPSISLSFLVKLSQFQPRLDSLGILRCTNFYDSLINALPTLFPCLGEFSISFKSMSASLVDKICNMKMLDTLEIINCTIALPDECPNLSHLEILYLINVKFNGGALASLLQKANKLITLHVLNAPQFDLVTYPYAENLQNLGVDASQLRLKAGVIEGLDRYTSLSELYLSGEVSEALKNALLDVIKNYKININFIGVT